jgi:hypothetical protein
MPSGLVTTCSKIKPVMALLYYIQYRASSGTPTNMQSHNRVFVDLVGNKKPTTHGAMGFES